MFTQLDLDLNQPRCMKTISDRDYGISYTPGKAIVMADALSRKFYCNNHMAYKAQSLQDHLNYREHRVHILVQAERHACMRAIEILTIQWSNNSEDEATWELEDRLRDEYLALFPSTT